MRKALIAIGVLLALNTNIAVASDLKKRADVVLGSEIQWGDLNPARGDASPRAANLWGDRTKDGATGFLVKFKDGFSSPPHIHNVTYRGVVISGLIHNDDKGAKKMWLPAGSFWTQPAGESHITVAQGENNLIYVEIDEGPYLVHPEAKAFDNGQSPVNIDKSNIVWLDASDVTWLNHPELENKVKVAFLWGSLEDGKLRGNFIKLPVGFKGKIKSEGSVFHAVVVKGRLERNSSILEPGSYFSLAEDLSSTEETIIYVRTDAVFNVSNKH